MTPLSKGFNPFDSESDEELETTSNATKASSVVLEDKANFHDSHIKKESSHLHSNISSARNQYKNDFRDSGGIENQSIEDLENYAVYKAEDTTAKLNDCLKIAEDIREDASKTLVNLHHQGEQIITTHVTAANIEYDLSRGEKLLASLGGFFSKKWRPKKANEIKGPSIPSDDSPMKMAGHVDQRQKLGLSTPQPCSTPRHIPSEPKSSLEKVEIEKSKQDDALSDLSNLLGELKNMAMDMGSEIGRQNVALGHMQDDVDELNFRVRGANQRGRRLLGK